jgi:hypothetical protein
MLGKMVNMLTIPARTDGGTYIGSAATTAPAGEMAGTMARAGQWRGKTDGEGRY